MAEKRYAILIGINDYEVMPLEYCVNDVDLIKDCFIKYCNVEEENIFPIKSAYNEPTEDIDASYEKAFQRIQATFQQGQDSIFFFFSGHGARKGSSTALVFKKNTAQLQNIYIKLLGLKPRFIFILVDSCFSGVGIEDDIDKAGEEYYLAQEIAVATGYCIFCASADDKPAKEDADLKNGRFTHLFAEVLRNKLNYHEGLLNLSTIYQELDKAFKKRPEFKQLPFSQYKGLSTYPLALIKEDGTGPYYSNHYIDDIDKYDWDAVMKEIKEYGSISNDMINEFIRLVREIFRNSKKWGMATHLQIEVSKNAVTLIDNTGNYFDLFNPPKNVKQQGGSATAKAFSEHFAYEYELIVFEREKFVYQKFQFREQPEDPCKLSFNSEGLVRKFFAGYPINIPKECKQFVVDLPQGRLDLSWAYIFLQTLIESSKKSGVPVLVRIPENDRLKQNIIEALSWQEEGNKGSVTIE